MKNIFQGIKIIDLTRVFSGPFATRHFADLGAEVIKIEPPGGDDTRRFPPIKNGWSGYYEILNRNKNSLILNLKNSDDLGRLYELVKSADVFVENFSPNVKNNLKIRYAEVKEYNPNIIYASLFGVSSSDNIKYYDVIAQAESGLASLNGENTDMKISTSIVDAFSGLKLAFAISSALFYRAVKGKGLKIDVSMKGSAFDLLEQNLIEASMTLVNPEKVGNMDNAIAPFGIFNTLNGGIAIACGNEKLWQTLVGFLESKGFVNDPDLFADNILRVKNIKTLKKEMEYIFSKLNKEEIQKDLKNIGIPCGIVATMLDVLNDDANYGDNLLVRNNHPKLGKIVYPGGGIEFKQ